MEQPTLELSLGFTKTTIKMGSYNFTSFIDSPNSWYVTVMEFEIRINKGGEEPTNCPNSNIQALQTVIG